MSGTISLKTTDKLQDGQIAAVLDEKGRPIVIGADADNPDEERGLDIVHLFTEVPNLRNQSQQFKNHAAELKAKLDILKTAGIDTEDAKQFEEWLTSAKKAIETASNLDAGNLKTAADVERIKRDAVEAHEAQVKTIKDDYEQALTDQKSQVDNLDSQLRELLIRNQFGNSKFVREKMTYPSDKVMKIFSDNFKIEEHNGKKLPVAYYTGGMKDGEKVTSKELFGEIAEFEEAIELLVNYDTDRDHMLKGVQAAGTGSNSQTALKNMHGQPIENPWKKDSFNLTEQGRIFKTDPGLAAKLKQAAGSG